MKVLRPMGLALLWVAGCADPSTPTLADPTAEPTIAPTTARTTEPTAAPISSVAGAHALVPLPTVPLPTAPLPTTPLPASLSPRRVWGSCASCLAPRAAIVSVFAEPGAASAVLRQGTTGSRPGYPFAVHSDELSLEEEGVVVVWALFASVEAAEAWPHGRGKVVAIGERNEPRRVVIATDGQRRPLYADRETEQPKAWLPPRSVAVVDAVVARHSVLGDPPSAFRHPVIVDGAKGFVDLRHTRLWTTVVEGDHATWLRQTVGVVCDAPIVHRWRFDPVTQRRLGEARSLDDEGC